VAVAMPEHASRRWRAAVAAVRARLRASHGGEPVALGRRELSAYHHQWQIVAGWRIEVSFGEATPRRVDILIPRMFPLAWPRFALVDRPPFLDWPHVERDGILCLLSNMTDVDPSDPAGVVVDLLSRAVRLVGELIDGGIVERDFRDEFLTYWRYDVNASDARLTSIVRVERPSREIRVWQAPDIKLLGEDEKQISGWLLNRFGKAALRRNRAERAMLIWLDRPLLPSEYPETARNLLLVAERAGPDVAERLAQIATARQDNIVVVIAADGRFGPGLVVVTVTAPGLSRAMPRGAASVDRGFRPSKLPAEVLVDRYFGSERVRRDEPARADAPWVHGRGHDPRTAKLAGSVVTVLGCGSVGAPVAVALAQAGVGRINLVDHDALAWANVGRHPLGASSVSKNKAEALAAKLRTDYPHSTFEAYATGAAGMMLASRGVLLESDLIVSAMGSWLAESQLNDWHCREDRPMPIVYGWTEAHACAGHAVVVDRMGGCLRCGVDRTGMPAFRVTAWPEGGSGALEEPACGAHYQAYGPIELGFVTGLVSQAGLDCLLGKAGRSTHRLYAARRGLLDDARGSWSADFVKSYPGREEGGFIAERDWPEAGCAHCAQAAAA